MLYSQAAAAAPIKINIDDATAQTASMGSFTNSSAQISVITFGTADGRNYSYQAGTLSVSESATIFNALFTIFNNRLTNYNSQLSAL